MVTNLNGNVNRPRWYEFLFMCPADVSPETLFSWFIFTFYLGSNIAKISKKAFFFLV